MFGPRHRLPGRGHQRARRLGQRRVPPGLTGQRGQRGLEGQFLGAAGVHAAEQRVDEAVHDLLAEPGAHVRGHRYVAVPAGRGQVEVTPGAGHPVRRDKPGLGQLIEIGRHAHDLVPRQRVQFPLLQIPAAVVPGRTRCPVRPTAPISPVPSGRRVSSASAPSSTATPATSETVSFPPSRGDPSKTVTWHGVRRRKNAAASPAMPPPAMTTAGAGPGRLTRTPWQNPARRGEPGRRATAAAGPAPPASADDCGHAAVLLAREFPRSQCH